MTSKFSSQLFRLLLLSLILGCAAHAFAQDDKAEAKHGDFCSGGNYWNDKQISFKETREINVAAGGTVNVDAQRNGGISVKGENRSDVLVRACIQTSGATEQEAQTAAKNVRIDTGSTIHAENLNEEKNESVSYEILVPVSTNLKLKAHNGGISVSSVEGNLEFETMNGGVSVRNAAGSVKGRTANGGINVVLSGNQWRGGGLDVETTNGGVNLQLPETYQAHIETGTVNGRVNSSISGLSVPEDDSRTGRISKKRISTDLNGGGATVRVVTTNGGVRIGSVMNKVF